MENTNKDARPQVIVVGAGPSGLAMAIELGMRGIRCLVLERGERGGYAPRAKTTHTRTREHLRRWGIAGKLAEASPFGIDYPSDILFVTRLMGPEITRFPNAFMCAPGKDERYSEHSQWVPQYKLEAVLREHAQSLDGVTVAFGQQFISCTQSGGTVTVKVLDRASGTEREIETEFLIGADGARSRVREQIGATMIGQEVLSRHYNVIFRAPGLKAAQPHADAIMIWQINPDTPSIIGPMDQDDVWYFGPARVPPGVTYEPEEMTAIIHKATGSDGPIEILSSDEWVASKLMADKYSDGRIYLIGDACHLHPPFGGYGMNMGVADGVDLGWKVAAYLQGWGGEALLDSYEAERRPTHQFVIDEAAANHSVLPHQLLQSGMEDLTPEGEAIRQEIADEIRRTKPNEFYSLGVTLGYRYQASPVIAYDADDVWEWSREYVPSATPGSRAPHHWMDDGRSLFDLFGLGYTLLVFADAGAADIEDARQEAARLGVPFDVVVLEDPDLRALYGAGRALIRPDQHVVWRGDQWRTGVLGLVAGKVPAPV